jgi:cation:H+ antiporter
MEVTTPADVAGRSHEGRQRLAIAAAAALTLPALGARLLGEHPVDVTGAAIFGVGVVGAAFLLAWGAEALQMDVARGLALAVLALIAVLPEYAVDFTFAIKAGDDPGQYAPLALANMTGGNRLLIGIGWPLVVFLAAFRMRKIARERGFTGEVDREVYLSRPHAIEIAFLAIATLYSLSLPLKDNITLWDAAILVGLYVLYAIRVSRAPTEEPHLVGPAELLGRLPKVRRRLAVGGLLAYAAAVILLSAEPFAESLIETGEELFLTAAQSAFAVAVLASRGISVREAAALLGLFVAQFLLGAVLPADIRHWERIGVGFAYLVLAAVMLWVQRSSLRPLVRDGLRTPTHEMIHGDAPPLPHLPR